MIDNESQCSRDEHEFRAWCVTSQRCRSCRQVYEMMSAPYTEFGKTLAEDERLRNVECSQSHKR